MTGQPESHQERKKERKKQQQQISIKASRRLADKLITVLMTLELTTWVSKHTAVIAHFRQVVRVCVHVRVCVCGLSGLCIGVSGKRPQCGPLTRYKDTIKVNMKRCSLQPKSLSTAALDRTQWRTTCQSVIAAFEETRVAELDRKRAARKQKAVNITDTAWPCDRCNKICSSCIGLFAHRRTHR